MRREREERRRIGGRSPSRPSSRRQRERTKATLAVHAWKIPRGFFFLFARGEVKKILSLEWRMRVRSATEGENDLLPSMPSEGKTERAADVTTCLLRNISINSCPIATCFPRPERASNVFFCPFPFFLCLSRCRCRHSWRAWYGGTVFR